MDWLTRLIGRLRPAPAPPAAPEPPHKLETSIREHLAPLLREDGFTGSGRTFRRRVAGLIHVVSVQGSSDGGRFAVNLGVQPLAIPTDRDIDPRKITETDCVFRRRLSRSGADQWWPHDGTRTGMDVAVQDAASVYAAVGGPAFAALSADASPLRVGTVEEFANGGLDLRGFRATDVVVAHAFALMRQAEGKPEAARDFALWALEEIEHSGGGVLLRRELRAVADAC
ncbi:hypothetical protein CFHF_03540 [Caulobacter flavus]|uniref:DUF4304 domain-containing protein n=1 Tax=Caulobacter flavus TaxID=1679497 RepID=A0A2N5CZ51_9CAUL|nr:DUF4304 domain-containing protein [Caulobacter flavus]AYV45226.1 hypothetical protein C1707_02630 [Caulobacter flavus]PLR19093.1 hypothetical protein CFHF_03540 [Caulobacter flavus]